MGILFILEWVSLMIDATGRLVQQLIGAAAGKTAEGHRQPLEIYLWQAFTQYRCGIETSEEADPGIPMDG
jgi:hypothetical protein